jgi:DNA-binding MarR family transcriptional regulator
VRRLALGLAVGVALSGARVQALDSVRTLVASLYRSARAVERRSGLTNAQLYALQHVGAFGPLGVNDLTKYLATRQSTVSSIVARLVGNGLVRREPSRLDGRRVVLTITPAGRRRLRIGATTPIARLIGALEKLPDHEARRLASSLDALLAALAPHVGRSPILFETPPA